MATNEELINKLLISEFATRKHYIGDLISIGRLNVKEILTSYMWGAFTSKQKCILLILQDRGVV